jgi:hypothetical protein
MIRCAKTSFRLLSGERITILPSDNPHRGCQQLVKPTNKLLSIPVFEPLKALAGIAVYLTTPSFVNK